MLKEPPPPELTDLQMKILGSLIRGLSNNDIATEFGLSLISTKRQLASIFTALNKHLLKA